MVLYAGDGGGQHPGLPAKSGMNPRELVRREDMSASQLSGLPAVSGKSQTVRLRRRHQPIPDSGRGLESV